MLVRLRSTSTPLTTVKLTFIHHSCGSNWLATENGNLGTSLNANNYYVTETNYEWDTEPNDNLGGALTQITGLLGLMTLRCHMSMTMTTILLIQIPLLTLVEKTK